MKIITISGVDGSGKSTQTQNLISHLKDGGYKPFHFHAIKFSIASSGRHKIKKPGDLKPVTKASWFSIQLRKFAFLIDLFRFEFFCRRQSKLGYTHIVSDRYYYDTLINILYLSQNKVTHYFGVDFLMKLVSIPHKAYYLDVSPDVIAHRERTAEQGREYMKDKVSLYKDHLRSWNIASINGERSAEIIAEEIQSSLEENVSNH